MFTSIYTTLNISCQIKLPTGSKISDDGSSIILANGNDIGIESIRFADLDGNDLTSLEIEDVESVVLEQFNPKEFAEADKEKLAKCTHIELNGEILSKIIQDQQMSGVYVFADDEGLEYEIEENTEELLKCKFFALQELD